MKVHLFAAIALALTTLAAQPAAAGPNFPDRGRAGVVDAANVIPDDAERALNARVVAWDRRTGHQLVVATVPSLQGYDVKDFGYQLGRAWGLGQKGQDDGVILLLAPTERRVRIEVGYGLEPVLSDAIASGIIGDVVAPKLKAGEIPAALSAGADRIMSAVDAAGSAAVARPAQPGDGNAWRWWLVGFLILAGITAIWRALVYHRQARALAAQRDVRTEAFHDTANAIRRFAEQSRDIGRQPTAPLYPRRPFTPTPPRITRTVGPVSGPTYAPDTYTAPPPPPPSPRPSDDDGSSSGSSDWGSSFGGGGSSDSGFDSGGGSFGGGGADSSY